WCGSMYVCVRRRRARRLVRDWSSDVCSSDLVVPFLQRLVCRWRKGTTLRAETQRSPARELRRGRTARDSFRRAFSTRSPRRARQIGRASCGKGGGSRERPGHERKEQAKGTRG